MARELIPTAKQLRFADCYVDQGGKNATKAAIAAGYPKRSAHAMASALLRHPSVLEAIHQRVSRELKANVAVAAKTLYFLATNAKSESVQLQAAQALLDRGGMQLIGRSEHRHVIEDRRTDDELRAHVANLSRQLGLTAKLIEAKPLPVCDQYPIADAEFVEVQGASEPGPTDSVSVDEQDAGSSEEVDPFS